MYVCVPRESRSLTRRVQYTHCHGAYNINKLFSWQRRYNSVGAGLRFIPLIEWWKRDIARYSSSSSKNSGSIIHCSGLPRSSASFIPTRQGLRWSISIVDYYYCSTTMASRSNLINSWYMWYRRIASTGLLSSENLLFGWTSSYVMIYYVFLQLHGGSIYLYSANNATLNPTE